MDDNAPALIMVYSPPSIVSKLLIRQSNRRKKVLNEQ